MIPPNRLAARAADESRISKAYGAMTGSSESGENQLIQKIEQALQMATEALAELKNSQAGESGQQEQGEPMSEDTGSPSAQGMP